MENHLALAAPLITKRDTNFYKSNPACPKINADVTVSRIRGLTDFFDLTVSRVISETCEALHEVLCNKYLNAPRNKE